MTDAPDEDPRDEAMRAVEAGLSGIFAQYRRLIRRNAEALHPGMLPGTYKLFTVIVRQAPVTASELGEWLEMDKSQISRLVKELEELGLVSRHPDETDRRSYVIEPTEEGRERLELARTPQEATLRDRLSAWEVDDVRRLGELLHALTDHRAEPAD